MLMELVGKLLFLNEYGELGNINPGDKVEASARAAVVSSCVWVVSIVYLLDIFFIFAGEMAWCAFFALVVGYGQQGRWWRHRRRQWGK